MFTKLFKKISYKAQIWFLGTPVYHFYMQKLGPIMRLTTDYARPSNKKLSHQWGALEREGYIYLQPGDIIFTIDEKKVVAKVIGNATKDLGDVKPLFIPSHACMCIAKGRELSFEIAEMTARGFTRSTWEDVVRESTRVVIARCDLFDDKYIEEILIPKVLSFKDKLYDEKFRMGEDTLACSEMVYFGDVERRLDADVRPLIGDDPYITPVGLLIAPNLKIIWDSND